MIEDQPPRGEAMTGLSTGQLTELVNRVREVVGPEWEHPPVGRPHVLALPAAVVAVLFGLRLSGRAEKYRAFTIPVVDGAEEAAAGTALAPWLVAAFLAFLTRAGMNSGADIWVKHPVWRNGDPVVEALYSTVAPVRVPFLEGITTAAFAQEFTKRTETALERGPYPLDLRVRYRTVREQQHAATSPVIAVEFADDLAGVPDVPAGTFLLLRLDPGGACQWWIAEPSVSRPGAALMVTHAAAFLENIVGSVDAELASVPLGTRTERAQMVACNDTSADFPLHLCVHELVAERARRTPGAPAVIFAGETLSYGELDERSSLLADRLRGRGAGPEVTVGVYLRRAPALVVVLLAVMKTGAAYLPLDPLYPAQRISFMIDDSRSRLLVSESALAGALRLSE